MDNPGPSWSSDKDRMEASVSALNMIAQGKRNMVCGEVPTAVNQFQEACKVLSKSYGETAKECADAYYQYGRALLDLARMETGVLGNALQGVPEEEDGEKSADEQFEKVDMEVEDRYRLRAEVVEAMSEQELAAEKKEKEKNGEKDGQKEDEKAAEKSDIKSEDKDKVNDEKKDKKAEVEMKDEKEVSMETDDAVTKDEKSADKQEEEKEETKKFDEKKKDDKKEKDEDKSDEKKKLDEKKKDDKKEKDEDKSSQKGGEEAKDKEDTLKDGKLEKKEKKAEGESSSTKNSTEDEEEGEEGTEEEGTEEDDESEAVDTAEEGDNSQEEGSQGEKDGEENADDVSNLQLAWEMLELAKVIYLKDEDKEAKLKAADAYLKLGEVSLETEQYPQSVLDFTECLNIQTSVLEPEDRSLAETHYQLGLAYSFNKQYDESIDSYRAAVKVMESKIETLKKRVEEDKFPPAKEGSFDDPKKLAEQEISDLKEILPDIRGKVDEVNEERRQIEELKKMAKEGMSVITESLGLQKPEEKVKVEPKKPATDISHLIRRKRKPDEEEEPVEAKKTRQENGSGDAPPKMNGVEGDKDTMDVDAKKAENDDAPKPTEAVAS
ncbi:protein HGV2-like [Mizuhopecten yessoensis]|uniref:Histone-binding protein N1/N2 n=1 Tax=Mizuhopecten yessoensis TaxID=6573 RepID=A0A210QYG6_MIZYE|nr:protein HGV2-like [Mizuhopecten yessoensis]OWF53789.1 Histone-binding protein N1/N2 [Mizuhopecten yessoensis]